MSIKQNLDSIIDKWYLLNHPFYQAWNDGTLTVDALKVYATEYGNFINTLEVGWKTLGDLETAEEELEHAELWGKFAKALRTKVNNPEIAQTIELLNVSKTLFTNHATALGAMYAFEAQQPATAKSKLEGLKKHFSLPVEVEPYFEIHSENWHESEKILLELEELPEDEQMMAEKACATMAESLWNALTGIHENTHLN